MRKDVCLHEDDMILGYKKNDRITVEVNHNPKAGSLVVIQTGEHYFLCRYENIEGKKYLWPPRGLEASEYDEVIVGEAVELSRSL